MIEKNILELSKKLVYEGKEYHEIKDELTRLSLDHQTIEKVLDEVDQYIVDFQLASQEKGNILNQMIIGGVLFIIGAGITGYTYAIGNRQYILAYGAILSGAWIFKEAYKKYKLPIEDFIPRNKRFKRKNY